jgi:hypothetical protein
VSQYCEFHYGKTYFAMLDAPQNLEFVIRETRRKFQHTVAELTAAWTRVS